MNELKLLKSILDLVDDKKEVIAEVSVGESFLEVGKIYAFRTVTMIYTGRLKAISKEEFLIDEAAWIPETERWADFVDTGAHKEAEPYKRPVVLSRGAMLDVTELTKTITKQK